MGLPGVVKARPLVGCGVKGGRCSISSSGPVGLCLSSCCGVNGVISIGAAIFLYLLP